jgi:hypothetical protein
MKKALMWLVQTQKRKERKKIPMFESVKPGKQINIMYLVLHFQQRAKASLVLYEGRLMVGVQPILNGGLGYVTTQSSSCT